MQGPPQRSARRSGLLTTGEALIFAARSRGPSQLAGGLGVRRIRHGDKDIEPRETDTIPHPTTRTQAPAGASRLLFVDGLRGIAALVVAAGHIVGMVPPDHPATNFFRADLEHKLLWPVLFGGQMVWLFIMLSGFALYWSEEERIATGRGATTVGRFARRRAWRILPTYYVAFVLGLVLTVAGSRWLVAPSPSLHTYRPLSTWGVVSHLGLVHNLNPAWTHQANPPLWSIAVEAQLYVFFPLLAYGARRWSFPVSATVGVLAATLVLRLSPVPVLNLAVWFICGCAVAYVVRRRTVPRRLLLTVAGIGAIIGLLRLQALTDGPAELVWMTTFACLIAALASLPSGRANVPTWRPIVWVGQRSYSLYATHFPIALLLWSVVARCGFDRSVSVLTMLGIGVPLALLAATLCYHHAERPSLARAARARTAA